METLQSYESLAKIVMSWKEDLLAGSQGIKDSGSIEKLEEIRGGAPSGRCVAVGLYVCLAAEILLRDFSGGGHQQTISDIKRLNNNFLNNKLKIVKTHLPKVVVNALDKLSKDWVLGLVSQIIGPIRVGMAALYSPNSTDSTLLRLSAAAST